MKILLSLFALLPLTAFSETLADAASMSAQLVPEGGHIVIDARGVKPKTPVFFSAVAKNTVRIDAAEASGEIKLALHIVQGRPEILTLGISGAGEVVDVSGAGLHDWAVRQSEGKRYLDLRPALKDGEPAPSDLQLTIRMRGAKLTIPGSLSVPLLAPGDAVGFASQVTLLPGAAVDVRVTKADGLLPLGGNSSPHEAQRFFTTRGAQLEVSLVQRGAAVADAELAGARLDGTLDDAAGCVTFELSGEARVQAVGVHIPLLSGGAALDGATSGEGWHVELVSARADLVFDRAGVFPVKISFVALVSRRDDWRRLNFRMPAGTVVPVGLRGFPKGVSFDPNAPVVPDETSLTGFLPANGDARFGWRRGSDAGEGTLFFTSREQSDVRVGAGLLRQSSRIDFGILQGKLQHVQMRLDGPGEILGVEGASVLSWKVTSDGSGRVLDVRLSRPFEKNGALLVRSQAALGSFPVKAEPLRLTPLGGVHHSGFVRISDDGAVRLEIANASGLMQLSPEQFPGAAIGNDSRQVFVYRFPSANYSCHIVASQILPEVGVSQVLVYEIADTDRVITADIELDIREAPLREWSLRIPGDYAVVAANGSAVSDYAAESESKEGSRVLKFLFAQAVSGRQLVHLRLEKNQPAAAGDWQLPALAFPGAKSVRGHVGVVAASGFRVVPLASDNLVEMPLSYFPAQLRGLQQAWRLREADWSAKVKVEALGQSVEADVFHLYTLKEGVVSGSVLINYFVIGAPASEWRIEVPKSLGNIDVIGQNVRRDWRRVGNEVIVSLLQPVLGPATLLITFEQPMSARGGIIDPGEVRPLGVQSERGFVQVVSQLQVKSRVLKADGGLLKLEPLEVPAEFRLLTSAPSLAVYQYTARPFALEMKIERYVQAETLDQVVDFAKLASHVSRDGQIVTDARYFVKTRGRKALRIILPSGVKLWEARADKEIVSARVDGVQTIVPLPPKVNPNEPVEVMLRLGQISARPSEPVLSSPKALALTVISEWTITGDPGQLLVPNGGTVAPDGPVLTETGFEWVSQRAAAGVTILLLMLAASGWLLRGQAGWKPAVGFLLAAVVTVAAVRLALMAATERQVNVASLACSAAVVPAGEAVTVRVANVAAWQAMTSWWGIAAVAAGVVLVGMGAWRGGARIGWPLPTGAVLLAAGVLSQRGGAILFFMLVAAGALLALMAPMLVQWFRRPRAISRPVAALLVAAAAVAFVPRAAAQDVKPAESMSQTWKIQNGRLFGEVDLRVRGVAGDSFLLLRPPAVLTGFTGDGLRVSRVQRGSDTLYFVALDRDGVLAAHATFEVPIKNGDPSDARSPQRGGPTAAVAANEIPVLTGPAAAQRVVLKLDEGGWEFASPDAVSVQPLAGNENTSGATLVFGPVDFPRIQIRPRSRDVAAENPQYFAEAANLFIPGPGVVNGYCRVTIRPVQGLVSGLELEVPKGLTVSDVGNGPVGEWRFDPVTRKLRVSIAPAQEKSFKFDVETQLGTSDLPVDLALEPIRVAGAMGEVGMIALAFGGDAQPENVRGLSEVNLEDFDMSLIPTLPDGKPLATLQQVFRYGREGGKVTLKVAAVAPEVRVVTREVFSFGDERLVLAADLHVAITRAGLFKLSFELPGSLEVEAISGASLNSWSETKEGGRRFITLQLNGRTIGDQDFAMSFTGAAPPAMDGWPVPRLILREATRQTGELFLVPEKGIRLRATTRENVSYLDPRTSGNTQPGTLAFRLLQQDWNLRLGIEALEPWVTAQALQDVTLREGQTLTRIAVRYRVENAAVKQLRVRVPGLTKGQLQTIRASGPAVSDFTKVAGEADLWEIHFQRGIAGETDVQIEYQGESVREQGKELVPIPTFVGAKQVAQFVAIRSSGRLEIDADPEPGGWQQSDWGAVPANLQSQADRSVPVLCFRVAEIEAPLAVNIHRHDIADALKLRVKRGDLTTLFSPAGPSITAVQLTVEVVEKGSMRMRLPQDAKLLSVFVNAESVPVVRDGDAYLFRVSPNSDADRSAAVRIVYCVPDAQRRGVDLLGPSLDVPLENVTWNMILPPGFRMMGYSGSLRLTGRKAASGFGLKDYENLSSLTLNRESKKAADLIDQANAFLKNGQQLQAGEVLSRAANANTGDEAFNEDARVQLRTLKTQQAVVGLNTRRQRLYLDNRSNGMTIPNAQLEQAASQNSVMRGSTDFDIQQVEKLLGGNTADENTALRGIADRIVEQQLSNEPAPGAIDVTLPESGNVITFARSIQVDGDAPLAMSLRVARAGGPSGWCVLALLGAVAIAVALPRRSAT